MPNPTDRAVVKLLKSTGCTLVRTNGRHPVWRRPDGTMFTLPHTAGNDIRALRKRILGDSKKDLRLT